MCAWPTSMQMPTSNPIEVVFDECDERLRRRQRIRNDLQGQPHAGAVAISCRVSMLRRAASRLLSPASGLATSGTPRCTTRWRNGIVAGHRQCRLAFRQRASAALVIGQRVRKCLAPLSVVVTRDHRRVNRVEHQACVLQPLRQRSNGDAVVIVEVRARREHLDALKAVGSDLDQVFAIEPLVVKEMRGDAEPRAAHEIGSCRVARPTPDATVPRTSTPSHGLYRSSSISPASNSRSRAKRGYFARLART